MSPPAESETAAPAESETAAPAESETAAPAESETAAPAESETVAPGAAAHPERDAAAGGWRHRDHTRGSLGTSLFVLALPLLATSLSGVLYQLVDLGFVSRLGEQATTAVIVTNQSIRQVVFMLVIGASFGAQAIVAQSVGAGDAERAGRAAGQVLLLGAGIGLAIGVVGLVAGEALLAAMNVSPGVLAVGAPYTRLVLALAFGFVFVFLCNGLLGGAGDSTTPMLISWVQTTVTLLAEWVLVFGLVGLPALGILGIGLGPAVGQSVGITLAAWVLFRGGARLHLRLAHLRPDRELLGAIGRLVWPPALQMMSGFLVTVYFLRLVGDFGERAQAAYSIGLRLSMVGPMLAFPMAGACATLVGQNLGAGRVQRAWRAIGVGLVAHVALLWTVAAVLVLFRHGIVGAFTDDPEVRRIGAELLVYQGGAFVAWAFYFVFLRSLQGAGDVKVPMLVSLLNAVCLTVPLGHWLAVGQGLGPTGIFQANLLGAWSVTLATGAWLATGRWTRAAASGRRVRPA